MIHYQRPAEGSRPPLPGSVEDIADGDVNENEQLRSQIAHLQAVNAKILYELAWLRGDSDFIDPTYVPETTKVELLETKNHQLGAANKQLKAEVDFLRGFLES